MQSIGSHLCGPQYWHPRHEDGARYVSHACGICCITLFLNQRNTSRLARDRRSLLLESCRGQGTHPRRVGGTAIKAPKLEDRFKLFRVLTGALLLARRALLTKAHLQVKDHWGRLGAVVGRALLVRLWRPPSSRSLNPKKPHQGRSESVTQGCC